MDRYPHYNLFFRNADFIFGGKDFILFFRKNKKRPDIRTQKGAVPPDFARKRTQLKFP